jgi:hypothetical protein
MAVGDALPQSSPLVAECSEFSQPSVRRRVPAGVDGFLAVFLARTQPNLLVFVREAQGACQPFEEYAVSSDFLEQWVCFRLACAAAHRQFGELPYGSFEAVQFVGCPAGLAEHLHLGLSQHVPVGHRQP